MKKKMIALMLIFAMLVPLSPAVAADENVSQPTIEEILNGYHEKAFAAHITEENGGASTYSRSAGSEKTLEEETVDELTAAGYEAYHVTGDNYEELEASLKTDFASMGLNPEGSYIVVISGEDNSEHAPSSNARVVDPPNYDYVDEGVGHPTFSYTYNENTYTMRYVTVTAADYSVLGKTSPVELLDEYDTHDLLEDSAIPISIVSSLGIFPVTSTLYSIVSGIASFSTETQSESLEYRGGTSWTVEYIQVYDFSNAEWEIRASVEYATMRYFLTHTYYDESTNQFEQESTNGTYGTIYSYYYFDTAAMKEFAAIATERYGRFLDRINSVEYKIEDKIVITHTRDNEIYD